jgi:hypothetical protein
MRTYGADHGIRMCECHSASGRRLPEKSISGKLFIYHKSKHSDWYDEENNNTMNAP